MEAYVGTVPLEGGGILEEEWEIEVAVCIDVAPETSVSDSGKTFGEMVGLLEVEGNDDVALEVDVSKSSSFFDEGQRVVVDIFVALGGMVLVFDGEDDVAEGVDDAVSVVEAGEGASVAEKTYLVIGAGYDFVAGEVEEPLLAVAEDADTVLCNASDRHV